MRIYDIINKKRLKYTLTDEEIRFFVNEYTNDRVPDYQASALLMAICINGMTDGETASLTKAMAASGDTLDLSVFGDISVDKHSTGGVGDKTTLIVAPLVASVGSTVCKLSGRGLGHTGGTLDKLESIPNCRIDHTPDRFIDIARECGVSVCGAGASVAPADKRLYALRDVTATVQSIPLIVSSIMSKKLAGGSKSIVLDVKVGSGAFMKTLEDAKTLANGMVSIGRLCQRRVSAVISNMSRPLGYCIGNSLEVAEAVSLLKNQKCDNDLKSVCLALSAEMVSLSQGITRERATEMLTSSLECGRAYKTFLSWISLQGGDVSALDDLSSFADAKYVTGLLSPRDGYIASCDASDIGIAAMMLGAGRSKKDDVIDPTAGIIQLKRVGDFVKEGSVVAILRSSTVEDHTAAKRKILDSLCFSPEKPDEPPLIYDIIR